MKASVSPTPNWNPILRLKAGTPGSSQGSRSYSESKKDRADSKLSHQTFLYWPALRLAQSALLDSQDYLPKDDPLEREVLLN